MRSSLMMSLLRILTPEEINELTTTSEGNKRVPLTQLMYRKMGVATSETIEASSLAKILPFTFPASEEEQLESTESDDVPFQVTDSEEPIETAEQEVSSNGPVNDEKMQTSVFILHEKKRLEANVHKMRSKELLKNYRKNASLDIEQERGLRDDMKKSSRLGVLVNKKHA